MIQIANDGNLLPEPVTAHPDSTSIGIAERYDIVIDFTQWCAIGQGVAGEPGFEHNDGREVHEDWFILRRRARRHLNDPGVGVDPDPVSCARLLPTRTTAVVLCRQFIPNLDLFSIPDRAHAHLGVRVSKANQTIDDQTTRSPRAWRVK